jgi:tRNA U34 5-methylaminomethyl-2-thiouridine-forming methyltransferase MnmC
VSENYSVVQLANGAYSLHSQSHGETFHPVVGPVAEAEALYVKQLRLAERMAATEEDFVVWDVGLGAAGNPLTLIRAVERLSKTLRIVSFDATKEPLSFALGHAGSLGYIHGFEQQLMTLVEREKADFQMPDGLTVSWQFHTGDFPALLRTNIPNAFPKPHAVFFDAFSPAKNPTMWTLDVFSRLYRLLDPARPCSMPTYSRSTLLRVTLLLAGFFVGVGHATGEKEETTIAANSPSLIEEPLDRGWLFRARRSRSAEPLHEGVYRQAPLTEETWSRLADHPQFS